MSESEERDKRLLEACAAGKWISTTGTPTPQESDIRSVVEECRRLREALGEIRAHGCDCSPFDAPVSACDSCVAEAALAGKASE
jgi:hypothetical protein